MPALMPSLVPTPMLQPKPPVTNTRASLPRIHKDRVLRTPEARFAGLTDFPYTPRYLELDGLRVAYIDEGPREAPPDAAPLS